MRPEDLVMSYWYRHSVAVRRADRLARRTGVRHRVERVTWAPPAFRLAARWYVSPTPAPAPSREVSEPCS